MSQLREFPQSQADDEIDLRELASIVIDGWYWILGSVVLAGVLGFGYSQMNASTWETTFHATEANAAQFQVINGFPEFELESAQVHADLANRLNSFRNFSEYLASDEAPALPETSEPLSVFESRLTVNTETGGSRDRLSVDFRYGSGTDGPAFLNGYVESTAEALWTSYMDRLGRIAGAGIENLERDIEQQEAAVLSRREDRLFEMERAITIARDLDIPRPTTPQAYGDAGAPEDNGQDFATTRSGSELPLYFMGYETLEAERDALEDTLQEGVTSVDIRELRAELQSLERVRSMLESGDVDREAGFEDTPYAERLVTVLDYAVEPTSPSGTSATLILVAALILGGFAGLVLTFVVHFTRSLASYRRQRAGDSV